MMNDMTGSFFNIQNMMRLAKILSAEAESSLASSDHRLEGGNRLVTTAVSSAATDRATNHRHLNIGLHDLFMIRSPVLCTHMLRVWKQVRTGVSIYCGDGFDETLG